MYDFVKLHIREKKQINGILQLPFLEFKQTITCSTGEVQDYPLTAKWQGFIIHVYSPLLAEIRGSLHKYFKSCNGSDYTLKEVKKTIISLQQNLNLHPKYAHIVNLEFGLNILPQFTAKEILGQVICYKNSLPINPFQNRNKGFLLDFKTTETYVKLYDKGIQLKKTFNMLRCEIKGMKARYFQRVGIATLHDLTTKKTAVILRKKLIEVFSQVVFSDDTIDENHLTIKELALYLRMKDPKEWVNYKGRKSGKNLYKERQFKALVKHYGHRKLCKYIPQLIEIKWNQLTGS